MISSVQTYKPSFKSEHQDVVDKLLAEAEEKTSNKSDILPAISVSERTQEQSGAKEPKEQSPKDIYDTFARKAIPGAALVADGDPKKGLEYFAGWTAATLGAVGFFVAAKVSPAWKLKTLAGTALAITAAKLHINSVKSTNATE